MKRSTIFIFLAPLLGIGLASLNVAYQIFHRPFTPQKTIFVVNEGEYFGKINYRLENEQIISSTKLFHRLSQFKGVMNQFKPGSYEIRQGMTMIEVLNLLVSGKVLLTKVTIPKGKNIFEIADILEKADITSAKDFVALAKNPETASRHEIPFQRVEGYLYPDTYFFSPRSPAKVIIDKMIATFKNKIKDLDFSVSSLSPSQIIVLASMVEKETGAAWERPKIAGVFLNRLEKRMRLQSDPTTIYGIFETYNGNLRRDDLLEKTDYNTYRIDGLPIGPIANPGITAIQAVLNPDNHQYLYFVSFNDGTHAFSTTYQEHLENVERLQKNPRARRGKSWRDLNKQNQ